MMALKLYTHNNYTLYTTLQNNGLIGLKISKSYCEILHLSVLPPSQQKGIASQMIYQIINLNPSIEFIIAETDLEAVTFYENLVLNPLNFLQNIQILPDFFVFITSKKTLSTYLPNYKLIIQLLFSVFH